MSNELNFFALSYCAHPALILKNTFMTEIWKPVVGYENHYHVSNHGRVKRIAPAKGATVGGMIRAHSRKDACCCVVLSVNCKIKTHPIHRLVAFAFLGSPAAPDMQVNHLDGNRGNNRLENLEWATPQQNSLHARQVLKRCVGENHVFSKLTRKQAEFAIARPDINTSKMARMLKVARTTIQDVRHGRTWKAALS